MEHAAGIAFILNALTNPEFGAIKSLTEIDAVGHRVVHGGEKFSESVLIDKNVVDMIVACNDLAPLHNPANLKGINAISAILPECTSGSGIRYGFPPNNACLRIHVRIALLIVRKIRCSQIRFSRDKPPLRITSSLRIFRCSIRKTTHYYLPYR